MKELIDLLKPGDEIRIEKLQGQHQGGIRITFMGINAFLGSWVMTKEMFDNVAPEVINEIIKDHITKMHK